MDRRAVELLAQLRSSGLAVSSQDGRIVVQPARLLTDAQCQAIRAAKPRLLKVLEQESDGRPPLTLAQERARSEVLAQLEAHPTIRRAFINRFESDVLILTLAIRDVGTAELHIPAERFNQNSAADYAALLGCVQGAA
jgi:hypothetical protein